MERFNTYSQSPTITWNWKSTTKNVGIKIVNLGSKKKKKKSLSVKIWNFLGFIVIEK